MSRSARCRDFFIFHLLDLLSDQISAEHLPHSRNANADRSVIMMANMINNH